LEPLPALITADVNGNLRIWPCRPHTSTLRGVPLACVDYSQGRPATSTERNQKDKKGSNIDGNGGTHGSSAVAAVTSLRVVWLAPHPVAHPDNHHHHHHGGATRASPSPPRTPVYPMQGLRCLLVTGNERGTCGYWDLTPTLRAVNLLPSEDHFTHNLPTTNGPSSQAATGTVPSGCKAMPAAAAASKNRLPANAPSNAAPAAGDTKTARAVGAGSRSTAAATTEEIGDHHHKAPPLWTVQAVERYEWDAPIVAALLGLKLINK